jgi:hypothetical protein
MAFYLLERHKMAHATLFFHKQAYVSTRIIVASNQIMYLNVPRFFVGKQVLLSNILIHEA